MSDKSCLNCKHCITEKGYEKYAKCSHPKCKKQNLVTGIFEDNFCEVARLFDVFCDKEAKWFELK